MKSSEIFAYMSPVVRELSLEVIWTMIKNSVMHDSDFKKYESEIDEQIAGMLIEEMER